MDERQQLEQAIAAQESLRGSLDDTIIDATIATLEEKLAALKPMQQRKLATILFTDIVESTRLTQGMDPEEQMALIDPLVQRLAAKISEHGGNVSRYQGDGFKAVFGLPVAHENDPAQAVRAALAIQAEAAQIAEELETERGLAGFQVRVGITTGLVFSGGETEGDSTIKGEAVNLASRLEGSAAPGTILISHESYKHVRGLFDFEPLEPVRLKGFSEPVAVYRVHRERERPFYRGLRGVQGVVTRMIGREPEFLQLQNILKDVVEDRQEQMVTMIGEAGVGKSRLLYEFENWTDLLPEDVRLYKGRAGLENQSLPYGLLRDMLASKFGIRDDDSAEEAGNKLGNGLGEGEAGEMQAQIIGHLLGFSFKDSVRLKGVLDNPQQLRNQAVQYLTAYFKSFALQGLVVILLEDLHWADEASLDALTDLALELRNQQVCILATARHGLLERRPHWGEGQDFHQRIMLKPLSRRESREMVTEVLQKVLDVPETLIELVASNAEGNPFYVEELVKMLVEDGIIVREEPHWRVETGRLEEVHVPPTLTGVLQARVDGLPEDERKALQGASVVGRVFWDKILEYINGSIENRITDRDVSEVLDDLRSRELIFRRETSAFAEANEHIFKHALLQEVIYESVLKGVRRAYHTLVAEWLIECTGDRAGEFTGLIADHLELAGNDTLAGKYLFQAGKQASTKFANQEAVSYLSRALTLKPETDLEKRYEILREREKVYDVIGNREAQEADINALEMIAEEMDNRVKQGETALLRANFAERTSDFPSCLQAVQRAVRIARETGNLEQEAAGLLAWGRIFSLQFKFDQAKQKFEEVFELARRSEDQQLIAHALRHLGLIASHQYDSPLAIKYTQECLLLYQEIDDRIGELKALNNLGIYNFDLLDFERALDYHEKNLALSREIGFKSLEASALHNLGEVYSQLGDYPKALSVYEQALQIDRILKDRQSIAYHLFVLSAITGYNMKDFQNSLSYANEGISIASELENLELEAEFYIFKAIALINYEKWAESEELLKKSIEMGVKAGFQEFIILRWEGLVRLYLAQGSLDKAVQQVNLILDELETNKIIQEFFWSVTRVLHVCCLVLQAANDRRYPEVLETAYNHLQNLAGKIMNEDMRNSFLTNVSWNRGIIGMWGAELEKN